MSKFVGGIIENSTGVSIVVKGATGVAIGDAIVVLQRTRQNPTGASPFELDSITAAHSATTGGCGMYRADAGTGTNYAPYRLDLPDSLLTSGADQLMVFVFWGDPNADETYVFNLVPDPATQLTTAQTNINAHTDSRVPANLATLDDLPDNFSTLSIDGSGRIDVGKMIGSAVTLDANNALNVSAKYMGGTPLTARDIGTSVLLSSGTGTGQVLLNAGHISNVDTLMTYTGNTVQTGDSYARLGLPNGASISADIQTRLATTGYTAPPSAATIASQIFSTDVDGVVFSTMLTNINAGVKGDVSVGNNGDDTYTLTFKKEDGVTTAFSATYNPSTGVRS
jgi:hypothetical protein